MGKDVAKVGDLFCGASGSSTSVAEACRVLGRPLDLVAVNHNPLAVRTHRLNHPHARHFCQDIRTVAPREAVPSGHLNLLLAGAPCPHFSRARGARPRDEGERSLPWEIIRWLTELDVEDLIIENVQEFTTWGPLIQKRDAEGRPMVDPKTGKPWMIPDPDHEGEYFDEFIRQIRDLGYDVEWRVLNSADYGAATIRRRLFIMCRRRKPVSWPVATNTEETYRVARQIIDWSIKGESIFGRKKPLRPNTIRRILAGLKRFGPKEIEPFLVMLYGTGLDRSISRPLSTVTAQGGHIGLVMPRFRVPAGVADLFRKGPIPIGDGCITPFFGEREGQMPRAHSLDRPTPAITSHGAGGLAQAYLIPVNHGTGDLRTHSLDEPMRTITGFDAWALIEPQIMKYYGTGIAKPVSRALDTVTCNDRFAKVDTAVSVLGETEIGLDILFRMLQPHELARAQGFPDNYRFLGSRRDVVRMIGNSWELMTGKVLCLEMLAA